MNVAQRNFSAGEITPSMYARTDLVKYATGLRTCRNFVVQRHGGVANRPGWEYIDNTKGNGVVQLIEFIFNTAQTYVMEFGDQYIRFYQNGGRLVTGTVAGWLGATAYIVGDLVSRGGVNYYCIAAHTNHAPPNLTYWYAQPADIYEIPTPYLIADLIATPLQFVQSHDVVTLLHPLYAPRELARFTNTKWTLTQIVFVPTIGSVTTLAVAGGNAGAINYWAVTAEDAGGRQGLPVVVSATNKVPSFVVPSTLTWNPVANAAGYRVFRSTDGKTYGFVGVAGGVTTTTTDTTWATTSSTISTTSQNTTLDASDQCRNACVATAPAKAVDGLYVCKVAMTITSSGGASSTEGYVRAYYSRDSETRVDAGVIGQSIPSLDGDGTLSRNITGTVYVPDNGYATLTIDLVAEVFGTAATGTPTFQVALSTAGAPWNSIVWQVGAVGFTDIANDPDYTQAPPLQQGLFVAPDTFPSVGTYYQQRLLLANTVTAPESVYASRIGDFHNYTLSTPTQDDDPVTFTIAGRSANPVQAMLDLGRLLILTTAGEYTAEGDQSGTLTPTGINLRQQLYQGAATLPPIVVGYAAIYLQARGSVVRDIVRDLYTGFKSNDLTLYATHLFDGYSIVDWAFQLVPNSVLWAVRSDGVLIALTYLVDQDVLGWHHHDTDGVVENVCVVPEGGEDVVYLSVRRTIDGETTRCIERMASRTITDLTDIRDLFFVDSGMTYDGRNTDSTLTMTMSGFVWDGSVLIPLASSDSFFTADDVENAILFYEDDGITVSVQCIIETYTDDQTVGVRPSKTVPLALRSTAITNWGKAVDEFTGLDHLEGEAVSVYGDGYVVASPNNSQYDPPTVVTDGTISLGQPYAVVHVGLPFTSDLETLDIDTPQGASIKPRKMLINEFTMEVLQSRGGWVGGRAPTGTDPLENLDELKIRDNEDEFNPIALRTDAYTTTIQNPWNSNGRVFVRNVDPIPLNVLAIIPTGYFPPAT